MFLLYFSLLQVEYRSHGRYYPSDMLLAFLTPTGIRKNLTWPSCHNTKSHKKPIPVKIKDAILAVARVTLKNNNWEMSMTTFIERIQKRFSSMVRSAMHILRFYNAIPTKLVLYITGNCIAGHVQVNTSQIFCIERYL